MKKKFLSLLTFIIPLIIIVVILIVLLSSCDKKTSDAASIPQPTQATDADVADAGTEPTVQYNTDATSDMTVSSTEPGSENPTNTSNTVPTVSPTTASGNPAPTVAPTVKPTTAPVEKPTTAPTVKPTSAPVVKPTVAPTVAPTTDPHAGKTYHEAVYKTVHHDAVYEDVWIVDQEAFSYEDPIYEVREYTYCKICGTEFETNDKAGTDAFFAHDDVHLLAGEGSGYRTYTRKIQVGTKTVYVPEEGHWAKHLVKAAWDEQVLVREAGWY